MTVFDYAVILIVVLSIMLSIVRGAVREVLSLAAWVLSFWAAQTYTVDIADLLPSNISNQSLRLMSGFALVFLAVLVVMSSVAILCSRLVKASGLSVADRSLGAVFGLARGLLIVLILVLLGGLTSLPRQPIWKNSLFSSRLETVANSVKIWLPESLSKRISYQ
ncbi:MAG TPA: CvpA family protein [Burkholderiales bacterium]|nr:CvpA family protein [Burkholderiales bacterium]HYA19318.1 CvpA family protein [Burkholderiales bacterium]